MKKFKSLMLLMATLLILTVALCINASAAEWIDIDENTQYTFDEETAVMVIKGEGKLDGAYFSEICSDHYAPLDDVFGCSCRQDQDWDPPENNHPGWFDAQSVKTLIIQEGITSIDIRAFYYFNNLEVAILPQSLTEIPAGAFSVLEKLHTVVLSNSITTIGESAFYNCANLKNIYMADTLKYVGKNAFYGCDKEVIRIPSSATVEVFPERPENLTAKADVFSVTLLWDKSENAEGYRVAYATPTDPTMKIVVSSTKATTCTVEGLNSGVTYYFYVYPYRISNGEVVWGEDSTIAVTTKAMVPEKVTASQSSNAIKLDWTYVDEATGYRIYEKVDGKWIVKVNSVKKSEYNFTNLEPGTKHTYAVRPYIEKFREIVWSDYVTITTATTPSTVTAKASSPSKGKITLTWNNVDGDIDGYRVYYKVGNGNYQVYKNYGSAQNLTFSNLKSGTKYTFAVRAGIKTSGGIVWSGYKESVVTVK